MKNTGMTFENKITLLQLSKKEITDTIKDLSGTIETIQILMQPNEYNDIVNKCHELTEKIKGKLDDIKTLAI